jgi:uncharacterized membrane protein
MAVLSQYIAIALLLCAIYARTAVLPGSEEVIPEFFDDDQNVYCLIIGFSIILLSVIIAIVIFRVKSRAEAFEGSLFQHLEDED